ncbi:hypothetical protein [Acinetobacter baumannii]|nr:hypothetical protein [Acinetobacter baumannii]MDV4242911.1 hypothetical protein [Acinetobacter baumannii]
MKYTNEQLSYIKQAKITENVFLNACPGSGKTETMMCAEKTGGFNLVN